MGREFRGRYSQIILAEWSEYGSLVMGGYPLRPQEIPAFISWLQEGPPTPKWRITREFDFKPMYVSDYGAKPRMAFLTDADVEKVG